MTFLRTASELEPGDHACLVYDDEDRRDELLLAFMAAGLERGERVVYVPEDGPDRLARELLARAAEGQVALLSAEEVYLGRAGFQAERTLRGLRAAVTSSRESGYAKVRAAGGPPASLARNGGSQSLVAYERRANELFDDHAFTAICAYDRRTTEPAALFGIVDAHPVVLYALQPDSRLRVEGVGTDRLTLSGWLDLTTLGSLTEPLADAVRAGGDVTLELSSVDFVDVAGLRLLAEAARLLHLHGHTLTLLGTPEWVERVLPILDYDCEGLVVR